MPASIEKKVMMTWSFFMVVLILLAFVLPQVNLVLPGSTLAWVLIALAAGITGSLERSRRLTTYGFAAAVAGLCAGAAVDFGVIGLGITLLAFGLVLGVGLMLVGSTTDRGIVPLGAFMLIGTIFQYFATPADQFLTNVAWLMLGGGAFASFGYLKRSPIAHFMGLAFIFGMMSVYLLIGENYFLLGMVGVAIILGSITFGFGYMYHRLGRPPKVDEILTLAARALFTYGLRRPLNEYRVIAITIQGDIGTELVIDELLSNLNERWYPILMLGPTSPTEVAVPKGTKLGWVSAITGVSDEEYAVLSPSNPSEVNIFINEAVKAAPVDRSPIIIGDFLDNIIPFMKDESFFRYYSDLASRVKVLNQTAVLIVKSDIHSELIINVVKRFADVIIENREREAGRSRIIREVRVSNKIDNFSTEWERIPPLAA